MPLDEYPFDAEFQLKILSLYVREPQEIFPLIEPGYFPSPIHQDICRLVKQVYEKHPNDVITKDSLKAIVKTYLGPKRHDIWKKQYRATIRKLYKVDVSDQSIVLEQAVHFAKERRFRKALVSAETDLNNAKYDKAVKRFTDLGILFEGGVEAEHPGYGWPKDLGKDAFHGIAGKIVKKILPNTEADAPGMLVQLLIGFGNAAGRNSYFRVGSQKHFPNLFAVLVGRTSKARKGTSWNEIHPFLGSADDVWNHNCIERMLTSGEGLVWMVRDPIEGIVKGKRKIIDLGVEDKRKLVVSSEFTSLLRVMQRDGNILSEAVRQAFDDGYLSNPTKNNPSRASGAHISIIGHATQGETLKLLGVREGENGFANRFLWVCMDSTKELPNPLMLESKIREPLVDRLREALKFAKGRKEIKRSPNAEKMWADVYRKLRREAPGSISGITMRGDALVMRLALVYALLDCDHHIHTEHLKAALAVWKYCQRSAHFIFGEALGDPDGEKVLKALRNAPEGMTLSEISILVFQRNRESKQLASIRKRLKDKNLIEVESVKTTGGAPKEVWKLKRRGTKLTK